MSWGFSFSFEGREIKARSGWTIAAALAAAGEQRLRETKAGEARGLFCGMGVCQDCLVEVDGQPNRRACMTKAEVGMQVSRQAFPGTLPPTRQGATPIGLAELPVESAELLVIGGGAGGLAAALEGRRLGLDVLLLDERPTRGGQYFKQAAGDGLATSDLPVRDEQQARGRDLRAAVEAAGARIIDHAAVWTAVDSGEVLVTEPGRSLAARGQALIVATGAYERPHIVPGWTLPGVITTGALQTLIRSYDVLPGKRILIAGNGPLNLQVALEARASGAEVVGVVEAAPVLSPMRVTSVARMLAADPMLTLSGARQVAGAVLGGVPLLNGLVVHAIRHVDGALEVSVGPPGRAPERAISADIMALGYGFLPSNELLRGLGCEHIHDAAAGMLRTVRDADGQTSVAGVYAVGDCAGLGGAPAALCEGVIAAGAVAARLRGALPANAPERLRRARRELERHRRFQRALWQLYAAPRVGLGLADADTLICRCEEVSVGALRAALGDSPPAIGEVKRRTRCGMGRCQGRYCGPALVEELARLGGRAIEERDFFAPRGPIKPVTIAELVGRKPDKVTS